MVAKKTLLDAKAVWSWILRIRVVVFFLLKFPYARWVNLFPFSLRLRREVGFTYIYAFARALFFLDMDFDRTDFVSKNETIPESDNLSILSDSFIL